MIFRKRIGTVRGKKRKKHFCFVCVLSKALIRRTAEFFAQCFFCNWLFLRITDLTIIFSCIFMDVIYTFVLR
jgi:ribosomal protein L37AE/L43A